MWKEHDCYTRRLQSIGNECRRVELNLLERTRGMKESELKEAADTWVTSPSGETVKREMERFRSVMLFGQDEDHFQVKEERTTEEQVMIKEKLDAIGMGIAATEIILEKKRKILSGQERKTC